jgi:aryl-alcohol dehydrogenase-like predicted oxidoreductase
MLQRQVGSDGPEVGVIGLGGMALSSIYHPTDDATALGQLQRAVELGVTHFDTSDAYGDGHNERLFGDALRPSRDPLFVATKFGNIRYPDGSRGVDGRPEYVVKACEDSLNRLGIETIDLFYIHRVDPKTPVEETIGAMAGLIEAGKVRHLGISEAAPTTVRRAHATSPLSAVQVEYSLWTRFAEKELIPMCEELGIAFVAYSPLGRGFLTGTIKGVGDLGEGDRRLGHPRFEPDNLQRNLELLQALQDVAPVHGVSAAQVALGWILAQSASILVIPSTTSRSHLEENVDAGALVLTDDEVARLGEVFAPERIAGERYGADGLAMVQI